MKLIYFNTTVQIGKILLTNDQLIMIWAKNLLQERIPRFKTFIVI